MPWDGLQCVIVVFHGHTHLRVFSSNLCGMVNANVSTLIPLIFRPENVICFLRLATYIQVHFRQDLITEPFTMNSDQTVPYCFIGSSLNWVHIVCNIYCIRT